LPNNLELALLSRIIQTKDFGIIEKMQITKEYFTLPESIELFNYLRSIYYGMTTDGTRGQIPSAEMVRMHFPSYYDFPSNDSVPILADQLRKEKIKLDILTLAQDLTVRAERDPMDALAQLKTQTSVISTLEEVGEELSMAGSHDLLMQNYMRVQTMDGLLGLPFPWKAVNDETQGMQNGTFQVIYGRPKSMKSWIAIWMAVYIYTYCRKRVLFYSREMPPRQVAQRVAASIARVDYKAFLQAKLQPELQAHLFTILQELIDDESAAARVAGNQPMFLIVTDRKKGSKGSGGGVGWLEQKIRDYKPDIVFVDGMYLMKDDRTNSRSIDWKNVAHISQDLKGCAQDFDIPLVGVTQANRSAQKTKGDDLTELSYADALGQDADAVFRVTKKNVVNEQTKQKVTEIFLTAPGLREGDFDGIVLHAHPATHFEFNRLLKGDHEDGEGKGYEDKSQKFRRTFVDPRIPAPRPPGT
jgi:replicative DNA helicase